MKRSLASNHSIGSDLKRRSSSLFSIHTVAEEHEKDPRSLDNLSALKDDDSTVRYPVSVTSSSAPNPADGGDSDGFYIEDDDDDVQANLIKPSSFLTVGQGWDQVIGGPCAVPEEEVAVEKPSESSQSEDHRTGIVFESGSKHFDRHNRYHKERPLRVTSIREALEKSDLDFEDRCQLLEKDPSDADAEARAFLEDDDYLSVHLPGYMQR